MDLSCYAATISVISMLQFGDILLYRPPTYYVVQVHLATLNGHKVVVKVQRPGLKQLFFDELKNVRILAQWLQTVDPQL